MPRKVKIGSYTIGAGSPLFLTAGPCVIEGREPCLKIARKLAMLAADEGIPLLFKASYDKANRTSHKSYRGPGLSRGLEILAEVKSRYELPVLTDVHNETEVELAAEVADVLQIPAFLCRQTDLVLAAAESGRVVNVKKGQFMAPEDMSNVVAKIESANNQRIMLTERGTSFGYRNLVADMRSLSILRETGYPVVFDATHSVQRPGAGGVESSGDGRFAPCLARAAVAAGCDGVFIETHLNPEKALSDRDNAIPFRGLRALWRRLRAIDEIVS